MSNPITDTRTANRNYPVPVAANFLSDDVGRIASTITAIDADMARVFPSFAGQGPSAVVNLPSTARVVLLTTALTAAATWNLPAANTVSPGTALILGDFSGSLTTSLTITVDCASATDSLNGSTTATLSLYTPFDAVTFISDGVGNWFYPVRGFTKGEVTAAVAAALATANSNIATALATATALAVAL